MLIPIVYIATLYLLASNNIGTSLIFQNNIWLKKHFDKAIKPKIWFVYISGMKPSHIKLSLATHIVQTSNPKGIWHTLVCTCPHQNLMSYVYNYSKGWLELTIPSLKCSTQTLSSCLKKSFKFGETEWEDHQTVLMSQFYHFDHDQTSQILHEKYKKHHYINLLGNFVYI